MPDEAFKVHGFSENFLKDKETFNEVVDEFLSFIKDKKIKPYIKDLNVHKEILNHFTSWEAIIKYKARGE